MEVVFRPDDWTVSEAVDVEMRLQSEFVGLVTFRMRLHTV